MVKKEGVAFRDLYLAICNSIDWRAIAAYYQCINEKILTRNPDPAKKGVKIDQDRYDLVRSVILTILKDRGELSNAALISTVVDEIERNGKVDYSVGWCARLRCAILGVLGRHLNSVTNPDTTLVI